MNSLRIILLAWLGTVLGAGAHPFSDSTGAANVRADEVLVELSVMLEDLVLFNGLKADAKTVFSAKDLRQAGSGHEAFLLKYFSVRDDMGRRLKGTLVTNDLSAIPDAGVPQIELMRRRAMYRLRFVPVEPKPKLLTFMQQFGGEKSVVPASMNFSVLHNGVWTGQPVRLAAGRPHSVELDWVNPPDPTAQLTWRQIREKQKAELEKRMGIASYTGLYSYIYLNDREVRHEILVPLVTFEKWLPLDRADPEFITVPEQEAAREKVGEWFRDRNPVAIDGIPVKPVLDRLQFFGLDINDFAQNAKPRRISAYQARLGIILAYPAKAPPNRVRFTWETFSQSAPFLRSIIYDREKNPTEEFFVEDKPRWEWVREGGPPKPLSFEAALVNEPPAGMSKISLGLLVAAPVIGLALTTLLPRPGRDWGWLGAIVPLVGSVCFWNHPAQLAFAKPKPMEPEAVTDHAARLLQNIYRAYDYREAGDVYDALAHSVTGDLLEETFLKIQNGLRVSEQGGAIARVRKVMIQDIAVAKAGAAPEIAIDCTWRVQGTVEHWGHIHTRENEYSARLTIRTTPEARGRISGFEITDEKRVRFDTSLRSFEDG